MSRYTIQLSQVIGLFGEEEVKSWFTNFDELDYLTRDELKVIQDRGTWSKEKLAQKIIDHYYVYEIGYETPALFRHQVMAQMRELMEEYLPLIYSASIKYDPLVNVDFTETFKQTQKGTGSSTGTANSKSNSDGSNLTINSDTPQGQISKAKILEGKYASSTIANELDSSTQDTSETKSDSKSDSQTEYSRTQKGNSGVSATAQKMVAQYRDNIRAFDREIINKLAPNFMGIF